MSELDLRGGAESQVVVGATEYVVQDSMTAFALTVRNAGATIAGIKVIERKGVSPVAYSPTWLGIALTEQDYFVSKYPIYSITLTAASDSVILHCKYQ